jgi:hydroxypyruvate isomerase
MPRFAANLSMMFQEWPFLDRFAAAADAGFTAVECHFPYETAAARIADRLERNGLTMQLFNVSPGDWLSGERGLAALPQRKELQRDCVKQAVEYAGITRTPRLHLLAGIADRRDPGACRTYRDAIESAAAMLSIAGLTLMIEPINSRDIPGYFLDDFGYAERLIAQAAIPNLKLQFDIYHRQIMHGDVTTALQRLLPMIGHVQVASVPDRAEPGRGELNDTRIFGLLDQLGYDGHIGAEYQPVRGTIEGLDWFAPYVDQQIIGAAT